MINYFVIITNCKYLMNCDALMITDERKHSDKNGEQTFSMWIICRIILAYFFEESVITGQSMKINTSCQGRVKKKFCVLKRVGVKPIDILFSRNKSTIVASV